MTLLFHCFHLPVSAPITVSQVQKSSFETMGSKNDSDSDAENNKLLLSKASLGNNNNMFQVGETDSSGSGSDSEDLSEDVESVTDDTPETLVRPLEDCKMIFDLDGPKAVNDEEILALLEAKHIAPYQLEKALDDLERAVSIR